jgi:hypothetical protein
MKEEWRDIAGYEGLYQVSDMGRVRSVERVREARNRWGNVCPRSYPSKILAHSKFPNIYEGVYLGSGSKCYLVHRLVASAFLPNPQNLREVNHKNGVRNDNRLSNLEWMSSSDNKRHGYKNIPRKKHSKITPVILTNGVEVLRFDNEQLAAKHLGVNQGSINSAKNRDHLCRGYRVYPEI